MKTEKIIWIAAGVALALAGPIARGAMGWTLLGLGIATLLITAAS